MTTIRKGRPLCTVIVTVDADPDVMDDLVAHARHGIETFGELDGYVSGALHLSGDRGRLVQYLQWETRAHHEACMNDPRWDERDSTRRFMALVESGRATIDVRVYDVVAVS